MATKQKNNFKNKMNDKFKLLEEDLLDENDIRELFKELDENEQYENMIYLIIMHPRILCPYYNQTQAHHKYNIEHKWNGDIREGKFHNEVTRDDIIYDLLSEFMDSPIHQNTKIEKLIKNKIFSKTSMEEELTRLQKD